MMRFSMPSGEELVRYATPIDAARYPSEWAQFEARLQRTTDSDDSRIEQKHSQELDTNLHIERERRGDLQNREPVKERLPPGPPSTPNVRLATASHATSANENIVRTTQPPLAEITTDPDVDTPSAATAGTSELAPSRDQDPSGIPRGKFALSAETGAAGATPALLDQNDIPGPTTASPPRRRQPVPRRTPPEVIQAVADALTAGLKARKVIAGRVKEKTGITYSLSQIGRIAKQPRSS
jgi:hypothetical protein